MRLKTILLGATLAGITLVASSHLAQAQDCPRRAVVSPSKETRVIRSDRYGYRFSIPQNYRTMTVRSDGILVFDPGTFETAQCLLKSKTPTEFPASISVYTEPVNSGNRSVTDWVKKQSTVKIIETTSVANQSAVVYTSNTLRFLRNVSFLTPDRKYIITLSVPYQYSGGKWVPSRVFEEAFKTVVSTFSF